MVARRRIALHLAALLSIAFLNGVATFCPTSHVHYSWNKQSADPRQVLSIRPSPVGQETSTSLNSFMGSDGGILGIGTPELFTILLVGYFVLGPSDLYKIVKEIGKFVQNIRTLSTDLTTTLESNMESQLQLEELRKAQAELTDAFSFRRSINVDSDAEAFSPENSAPASGVAAAAATAGPATSTTTEEGSSSKPKKIRRRVRKKQEAVQDSGVIPDLEMPKLETEVAEQQVAKASGPPEITAEEAAIIEREFEQYTTDPMPGPKQPADDFNFLQTDPKDDAVAKSRFQQQLSGDWNQSILDNEDTLGPLATVMNKIALLEKEKLAATKRLEEEFQKRAELDDEYYQKQRKLLEEAAIAVQDAAIGVTSDDKAKKSVV